MQNGRGSLQLTADSEQLMAGARLRRDLLRKRRPTIKMQNAELKI